MDPSLPPIPPTNVFLLYPPPPLIALVYSAMDCLKEPSLNSLSPSALNLVRMGGRVLQGTQKKPEINSVGGGDRKIFQKHTTVENNQTSHSINDGGGGGQ